MKKIIPLLLAFAIFSSCDELDPYLYRVFTMGNPQADGSLLGDDGVTYVFKDIPDWNDAKRVVAIMDVTKEVNEYRKEALLQSYTTPLSRKPVVVEGAMPDSLGTDPVMVSDAWYAGGYLNMSNVISVRSDGSGKHVINLAFDKGNSTPDTMLFYMKHNYVEGKDEVIPHNDYGFYSSFPLSGLMPERDSTVIKICWNWDGTDTAITGKVKI